MKRISDFIIGTCPLHPKPLSDVFVSVQFKYQDVLYHHFPCGSSVEFYIEPIHSCIDDIDVMASRGNRLAFIDDIPVLPGDVRGYLDTIECARMESNPDYPGFVEIRCLGEMRYNWHCKKFEFHQTNDLMNMVVELEIAKCSKTVTESSVVGPELKHMLTNDAFSDIVPCIWCPQWPKEAKHWPFRRRNYGWPTSANIRKIIQSGFHVVYAKHTSCRNDKYQWRLSFSVAEVILLQSWTPVQQIVYHMLRFFAKRELIKKGCLKEDEVLCTYHFKTLMLWSCEEKSPEWWSSSSVIELCCSLLRKLLEWLRKRDCPNYFIPQANLFHERMNMKVVDDTIRLLDEFRYSDMLSSWFAENYIKPILKRVFKITDNVEAMADARYCMLRIRGMTADRKLEDFDWYFLAVFWDCTARTFRKVIVEGAYSFRRFLDFLFIFRNLLRKKFERDVFLSTMEFSPMSLQFGKVLFILHATTALQFQQYIRDGEIFTEFVREVSWQPNVVRSKHRNFPKPSEANLDRSGVLFLKAQDLMENLTGLNNPQEFKLLSQLSKELLRNALKCDDFKSIGIRDAAFVYMAALHFSDSEHETAIELSSKTPCENQNEEEEKASEREVVDARCLFFIDDVVGIIGFYLLFRRIQDNFQYSRRRYLLDLRLTPEVFAHYLIISSNESTHRPCGRYYDFLTPTFPLDEILMTITNRKPFRISEKRDDIVRVYHRTEPIKITEAFNDSSQPNKDHCIQLLMEYSLENMLSFYNAICRDFGIDCNTADCYRAAYLYKCRKYPEVLQLCERILDEPDLQSSLKVFAFANVTMLPPLDIYFDADVQCLLGFHTLACYLSPSNEDLLKVEDNSKLTFQKFFARDIYFEKNFLSAVLLESYSMICHYFLGRHFLARYLKVRCLIDRNPSSTELLFEFKKLRSHLPFEHIIRCFVRQKLEKLHINIKLSASTL